MTLTYLFLLTALSTALPWLAHAQRAHRRMRALADPKSCRKDRTALAVTPEAAVVVELLVAALHTGAGIPRALAATGQCLAGKEGEQVAAVGAALLLGAPWEEAWELAPNRLRFLARTLRPAWEHGAPPASVLETTRARITRQNLAQTEVAAQRLAVHLVLPLGLCYLPSFIFLGVVPILFSLGGALLYGG